MASFDKGDSAAAGAAVGSHVDVSRNHYDVLEVNARTATPADIRRNFRRLCLKYHPDKCGGDDTVGRFQEIKVAYDVLSDPMKKAKFDHVFFYSRGTVPYNAKRIAEQPSDGQPSPKRARIDTGGSGAESSSPPSSPARPTEESAEGSVSPGSDSATAAAGAGDDSRLEELTIQELKALARERGINVTLCIEKSDIVKAIRRGPVQTAQSKTSGSPPQSDAGAAAANNRFNSSSSLLSQYWAFEREATLRHQWLGVSNESIQASTGLYEWVTWLRRVLESSTAYINSATEDVRKMQNRADATRDNIGKDTRPAGRPSLPPAGKFAGALEAHRHAVMSSLDTFRRTQVILSKLNEDLGSTARALKTVDAQLVVSGRHMATEARQLKDSAAKIAASPDLLAEAQRYSQANRSGMPNRVPFMTSAASAAAAAAAGMRNMAAARQFQAGVHNAMQGRQNYEQQQQQAAAAAAGSPDSTTAAAAGNEHIGDTSVAGMNQSATDNGPAARGTSTQGPTTGGLRPGKVAGMPDTQGADTATNNDNTAEIKRETPEDDTNPEGQKDGPLPHITVQIPENWQPGSKIKFTTDNGAIKFKPPPGCRPGDLMDYDPNVRRIKVMRQQQQPAAAATAAPKPEHFSNSADPTPAGEPTAADLRAFGEVKWLAVLNIFEVYHCYFMPHPSAAAAAVTTPINYYAVLGLRHMNASQDEIRQNYRRLCLVHHPDKGGSLSEFQKVQQAYHTLSDPARRRQYDRMNLFTVRTGGFKRTGRPPAAVSRPRKKARSSSNPATTTTAPTVPSSSSQTPVVTPPPAILKTSTLSSLSVGTLKQLAVKLGANILGCLEKGELIKAIQECHAAEKVTSSRSTQADAGSADSCSNEHATGSNLQSNTEPSNPAEGATPSDANPKHPVFEAFMKSPEGKALEECIGLAQKELVFEAWAGFSASSTAIGHSFTRELSCLQSKLADTTKYVTHATDRLQQVQFAQKAAASSPLLAKHPTHQSLVGLVQAIQEQGETFTKARQAFLATEKCLDMLRTNISTLLKDLERVQMHAAGSRSMALDSYEEYHRKQTRLASEIARKLSEDGIPNMTVARVLDIVRLSALSGKEEEREKKQTHGADQPTHQTTSSPSSPAGTVPSSSTGTVPSSSTGTVPSSTGTKSTCPTGTVPSSSTGTVPSSTGTKSTSPTGTVPAGSTRTVPSSSTGTVPSSSTGT
ncbi:hypothetical protein FOL47_008542, partial [Perkinsus chesapeaki]